MGSVWKDLELHARDTLEYCKQNFMGHFSRHSEVQNVDRMVHNRDGSHKVSGKKKKKKQ